MDDALDSSTVTRLWQVLVDTFDLAGLKDLAFDLAVDHRLFAHQAKPELARALIDQCEGRGQLKQLAESVLRQAYDQDLERLSATLVPGIRFELVQLTLAEDRLDSEAAFKESLADQLKLDPDGVTIVAAASESMRLLVGLPEDAAGWLAGSELKRLDDQEILGIQAFDLLDGLTQQTWRLVAQIWPPAIEEQGLRPAIAWSEGLRKNQDILTHIRTSFKPFSRQYLKDLQTTLAQLPMGQIEGVIQAVTEAVLQQRTVYVLSSGGVTPIVARFAEELEKCAGVPVKLGLRVFHHAEREDDVSPDDAESLAARLRQRVASDELVIAMSYSGYPPGLLHAVDVASEAGATTVAVTGAESSPLADRADIPLVIPTAAIEQIEDAFLIIAHIICSTIRESQLKGHDALRKYRQELSETSTAEDQPG